MPNERAFGTCGEKFQAPVFTLKSMTNKNQNTFMTSEATRWL